MFFSPITCLLRWLTSFPSPASQVSVNFELEKLRIELRHAHGMYATAHSETVEASQKLKNLKEKWFEESMKLKDVKVREERVEELAREEQERYKAAKKEAIVAKACAEREASYKRDAELKALRDMKEKENLENALLGHTLPYRIFSWEEIASATSSFSESCRIGKGAYGTVYRCTFHHTDVAVKVLHSLESRKLKQFEQELEILSKVRHPHLLLLIGACPDHGCLIYEHMENGSLDDRLLQKNGSPAIPWYARFRIAWEVASALSFLHNSKPNPIVHRDLKPANILLDHSFVSKIGDVGLSTALGDDPSKDLGPLLTARPAIALTDTVETAIESASLPDILDKQAGDWPEEETKELAVLGLRCAELRRKDRPDLNAEVLPVLEKLKEMADRVRISPKTAKIAPPSHFLCPYSREVLKEKDKSPMTNLPLPHKDLIRNHTLRSAIMEWNSSKDNNSLPRTDQ
ncbi:hypothetical protein MLD38_008929 [Melastoma candidum]|uniref:Uncharacterized protein n=1 Tax=Melastoma candidum TaxID=119954 RepID=A0ACB9RXC5_9MYRT|nr:hypothetical protein MLD38_008929 [Melastoma candidum]